MKNKKKYTTEREVYLIRKGRTNYYKIGVAGESTQRLKQLQTGNEEKLSIVKVIKHPSPFLIESTLHKRFEKMRVRKNGEWFKFNALQIIIVDWEMNSCSGSLLNYVIPVMKLVLLFMSSLISAYIITALRR